jgi:hypothetical protein
LRKANNVKPSSPDLMGQLKLQMHAASAIVEQFWHDLAQESFATSRHAELKVKVIRI